MILNVVSYFELVRGNKGTDEYKYKKWFRERIRNQVQIRWKEDSKCITLEETLLIQSEIDWLKTEEVLTN